MQYRKDIRLTIEPLALEYYNNKDNYSNKRLKELESEIIKLTEVYVFRAAKRNKHWTIHEDIEQAARLGVLIALRKYDPSKGSFLTWASWQIRHTSGRDKSQDWLINIPVYLKDNIRSLLKFEDEFLESNQRFPSDEEIIEKFKWKSSTLSRCRNVLEMELSTYPEEWMQDPVDVIERSELQSDVRKAIDTLEPKSKAIIIDYFINQRTMTEIAEKFGMSIQSVSKAIAISREKLAESLIDYR